MSVHAIHAERFMVHLTRDHVARCWLAIFIGKAAPFNLDGETLPLPFAPAESFAAVANHVRRVLPEANVSPLWNSRDLP